MTVPNRSSDRQELRRRQRGALSRSNIVALFIVACIALAGSQYARLLPLAAQSRQDFIAWSARKGFTIQKVDVTGRNAIPAKQILDALAVQRGAPILAYDLAGARTRLGQLSWIKTVTVERRLPQTVFVRIVERVPTARWQQDGKIALVDWEGEVLETDNIGPYAKLPIVIGVGARHRLHELAKLLHAEPGIGRNVVAATWVGQRRWDLTLNNGVVVKLPADEAGEAFARLAAYDRDHQIFARDIQSVDLRLADKAVVLPTTRANILIERPDFSDTPDKSKKNI